MAAAQPKISVMVSSTVYDIRPLLKQVFAILTSFGYDVWMSDRQTIPVDPALNNFQNCLNAVSNCDLFFGIITPAYGSGVPERGAQSITHLELLKAIELQKPRFMLCHEAVFSYRVMLNTLTCDGKGLKGPEGRARLALKSQSILKDLKTIDMLEAALQEDVPFNQRVNHWVQEYEDEADVRTFVATQFDPVGPNKKTIDGMRDGKRKAVRGGSGKGAAP